MAHLPEVGNGWEVLRGFVPAELAEISGRYVLELVELRKPYVGIRNFHDDTKALKTYFVDCTDPDDLPFGATNLLNDNCAPDGSSGLIEVIRRAEERQIGCLPGLQDVAVINRYDTNGYLGWHRDNQAYDSFILALMGLREYWVEDIESGVCHRLELSAGDALQVYNPSDISKRPGHRLRNINPGISLSLVR